MSRRQRHDLLTPTVEECIVSNKESVGALLNRGRNAVSALRLVLQLEQCRACLSDRKRIIKRRAITADGETKILRPTAPYCSKPRVRPWGFLFWLLNRRPSYSELGGPSARSVSPVRPLELALKRPF